MELLGTYLNDHLAGSTAGRDLARKLATNNAGTGVGDVMEELATAIEEDRATLEQLMSDLGVPRHTVKEMGSWMAEKVTRLRFSQVVTGSAALSQLLEMETLSMGIHGKRSLWQTLGRIAATDPRLAALDTDTLVKRADDQIDRLEPERLESAARAFAA